jgi:hypothetical protein
VAALIGVWDAAGAVVPGGAVATGAGVGIGLAVGVWPGARVCLGVGLCATVGPAGAAITPGPPTLAPPRARGSVASAGAHDATARSNPAAPATEAIALRLITDRPPGWMMRCRGATTISRVAFS